MTSLAEAARRDGPTLALALETSEAVASKDRSNLYLVSRFLRDRRRYEAFAAMYAVMRVIDDMVDDIPDVSALSPAERRRCEEALTGWGERIEQAYAGSASREPLEIALAAAVSVFPVPKRLWIRFIEAMRFDLEHDRFDTPETFLDYAEGATVSPTTVFVYLLTAEPEEGETNGPERWTVRPGADEFDFIECGRHLGLFAYFAHILRDVAPDLRMGRRGRIYIPRSDLAEADLSERDLRAFAGGAPPDSRWSSLVGSFARRAAHHREIGEAMARRRFAAMAPDCRFILDLIIRMYGQLLDRIGSDPAAVFSAGGIETVTERRGLIESAARAADIQLPSTEPGA